MKKITSIVLVAIFIIACAVTNKPDENKEDTAKQELVKQIITEDLNSRFVKFEIVEISKDSSNMKYAYMALIGKIVSVSQANLDLTMEVANLKSYDEKSKQKCLDRIQFISDSIFDSVQKIEMLQFSKEGSESCYYVKYRVFKDEIKIEKEEIFYIDSPTSGMQYTTKGGNKVSRYPYKWDEFLGDSDYDELKQKLNKGLQSAAELLYDL